METKNKPVYKLTFSAVIVALASALSLIKIYELPLGGSVTLLSMLPIVVISISLGLKWGVGSAFVYSLIQLFFGIVMDGLLGWGLTPAYLVGTIFLDYIIAFTVLGFAGAFAKKGYAGTLAGISLVFVLRFISHLFSGAILFGIPEKWADKFSNVWLYSAAYNGSYMLPELVITLIAAAIIFSLPQDGGMYFMLRIIGYGRLFLSSPQPEACRGAGLENTLQFFFARQQGSAF